MCVALRGHDQHKTSCFDYEDEFDEIDEVLDLTGISAHAYCCATEGGLSLESCRQFIRFTTEGEVQAEEGVDPAAIERRFQF